jgi:hypothetical protein
MWSSYNPWSNYMDIMILVIYKIPKFQIIEIELYIDMERLVCNSL